MTKTEIYCRVQPEGLRLTGTEPIECEVLALGNVPDWNTGDPIEYLIVRSQENGIDAELVWVGGTFFLGFH